MMTTIRYEASVSSSVDLSAEDYSDLTRWMPVITYAEIVEAVNKYVNTGLFASESTSVGVLVNLNSLQGGAQAHVESVDLGAGDDVIVQAIENATFKADMNVEVTSSGGGLLEKGSSTAVGITISTNQMDTEAVAYIDSTVVAGNSDTTSDHNGVAVLAENTSTMDADLSSVIRSNGNSVGIVLSFNSMGFGGSNLLFSVIDTLIPDDPTGDNESLSATRDGKTIRGATADAHISDSSVTANSGGDITIDAQSDLNIDADITNAAVELGADPVGRSDHRGHFAGVVA